MTADDFDAAVAAVAAEHNTILGKLHRLATDATTDATSRRRAAMRAAARHRPGSRP